jgi:predicted MFS family arabinose efflux permease
VGAVGSSLFFAHRFNKIRARIAAVLGFCGASVSFFLASNTVDYVTLAFLHCTAGITAGCALTFTHGTIGRNLNPHRMFAIVGMALGVFAIAFLALTPKLVSEYGGPVLFNVFGGVMLFASLFSSIAFPDLILEKERDAKISNQEPLNKSVWFGIAGISCMALNQAMIASFIERIGSDRGFGFQAVTGVLISLGFVNLMPAPLAAVMEKKWSAYRVVLSGPIAQAVLSLVITQALTFPFYAGTASVFIAVMIFTHTFAFGLLAGLDKTGRSLAATPAMLMVGSAIGPILGGTLVKSLGYESLGYAATVISIIAVACFSQAREQLKYKPITT